MVPFRFVSCCTAAALAACATSEAPPIDDGPFPSAEAGAGDAANDAARDAARHADASASADARDEDPGDASSDEPDALVLLDVVSGDGGDAALGGIDVPGQPGAKVTAVVTLPSSPTLPRLTLNSCRGGSLGFSSATSFAYLTLRNDDPSHDAVVSVWTSRAPGGPVVDTLMASYSAAPQSNAERLACVVGVEKRCRSTGGDPTACLTESGGREWAGLMYGDGNDVTVPASGLVVVYVASYDSSGSGDVLVSVRTEALR